VYYMVMEYAEGNMLKELIAMTGPIPEPRALHIFKQIVNALAYAHSKEIIHRDIKPSNIMIDASDNIKVMDFGIARLMSDGHLTRTGTKLGTLFYMSPEQVMAQRDIDHRSDIYSAGIVLYEILTGKLPIETDTDSDFMVMKAITEQEIPDPRTVYPHITEKSVSILGKATKKQREDRYQDCSEFYADCCGDTSAPIFSFRNNPGDRGKQDKPPSSKPEAIPKPINPIDMIMVEGGTFERIATNPGFWKALFGSSISSSVTLSSFYVGKCQITQKEWGEVMGNNPSYFEGDELPVEQVSWYDAVDFCNKRSLKEGLKPCYSIGGNTKPSSWSSGSIVCDWSAEGYRLPTEAEWEYAARGGNKSKGYNYSGSNDINAVAWFIGNSGEKTHSVGTKSANELGIHDLTGNVWEWCWDWYDEEYYSKSPSSDPRGASSGDYRVLRGGSWNYRVNCCRVAYRSFINPDYRYGSIGFRVFRAIH
ncbi:MAG: bifunctional serine/threonine-protein kinase/formylglycine-generating enzyme family protein, partial [Candidatus Cloacimonadaceae bacterium]|nr:bifunctional serine/threonine-protein kinase/formylglycine-generating enzyme family protein [Candidatus Cloacimonadaceae bacterium]